MKKNDLLTADYLDELLLQESSNEIKQNPEYQLIMDEDRILDEFLIFPKHEKTIYRN